MLSFGGKPARESPFSGQPGRRLAGRLAEIGAICVALTCIGAEEADPNVLEARSQVAEMADESLNLLKSQVALTDVEGWAVFSGDRLPMMRSRGIGLAEEFDGETYFMQARAAGCLSQQHRHVLVFRDADLFQSFRQGELQGSALERVRDQSPRGTVTAFKFRPVQQPELESMDLSDCRFALHKDLQRALVAEPSRTEGLVEEDDVDVDDN